MMRESCASMITVVFATLIVFHRLRKQNLFIIYTEYLGQDSYSNYKKVIEIEISNIFNT